MIVPKDANLRIQTSAHEARFTWLPPKSDKWSYAAFPCMFGAIFTAGYIFPGASGETPVGFLIAGLVFFAFGAVFFWLGAIARTTIIATPTQVAVRRVPFRGVRSKEFSAPPVQFYLTAGGASQSVTRYGRSLCMVDQKGISQSLATGISQTMASQLWYELQEFYRLEDLEVLGESSHQQFTDFRRAIKAE